ncbi:hypothetical protein AB0873_14815 [Micromonospora sp. NPDC047707]|uniref:hypothetical protein n=1 Tax=Micromonospora sp. NPDC047707 TaxID=3154498 RepID=UPI0034569576
MTHPPAGPHTPPPPSGPKHEHPKVKPLDPDSPAGRAAAEALSQALAEIYVAVAQRRAARQAREAA